MPTLTELEPQVLALGERERADLAARILSSLPAFLSDADDGVSEALRREAEAINDPSLMLTETEFMEGLRQMRGR